MDWNALKLFLAIAETGSLNGAARALGVNHSTVFRRLNVFEEQIGSRLFERLSHGYELTATGEELLATAKDIAGLVDDMERRIVGKDIQPSGIVRVTAPNNIAYRYLPHYITRFNEVYPDIRIELLISNLEFNMTNRRADIAVRATRSPPEHLVGRKVCSLSWSVYGSKAYKKKHGLPKKMDALAEHAIVGATGGMLTLPAFVWLEKNLPGNICVRCDELVAMAAFAEAGEGLALLPDDQQRPGIEKLFAFKPGKTSELWLLTHPDLRHTERIKLVMRHLAECFSNENNFSGQKNGKSTMK